MQSRIPDTSIVSQNSNTAKSSLKDKTIFLLSDKCNQAEQLSLFPLQKERLQIASCPIAERDEDSIYRYIFTLLPSNIKACWARFSADEAHEIFGITAGWKWKINPDGTPNYRDRLAFEIDRMLARQAIERPAVDGRAE